MLLHSPSWKPVRFNNPSPSGVIAAVCIPAWWPNASVWGLTRYPRHCSLQLLAPDKPQRGGCSNCLGRRLWGSVCQCQALRGNRSGSGAGCCIPVQPFHLQSRMCFLNLRSCGTAEMPPSTYLRLKTERVYELPLQPLALRLAVGCPEELGQVKVVEKMGEFGFSRI